MWAESGNPGVRESESENKTKQRSQVTGKTEKFPVTGAQFTKCVYVGWAHLAAGSLWGLGRFKAKHLFSQWGSCLGSTLCTDEIRFCRNWNAEGVALFHGCFCAWIVQGWHWEKVEKSLLQVSKGAHSGSTEAGKRTAAPDVQKIFISYPSPSTFDGSHILKWSLVCPIHLCFKSSTWGLFEKTTWQKNKIGKVMESNSTVT